ncbi:glycosyl hydrolase 53 family protein [Alteromonas sp. ASW11-36]|uniref:Arabinogalactan endo-beta-1,4-galactanase n=1 Tax=Alteromonas arenosi TaxID=3055817 RepID=A0ABT7SVV9_9ALTE|nr:glycosyl hydrolase 53 family protein [Alteromonas sp. ASW11-36]MDM7860337.1 glycosyl hydrolase 53 family protein [Alteromonas sp. ASW11-36]
MLLLRIFVITLVVLWITIPRAAGYQQSADSLVAGEVMGVAYSGFREGQHPDRGNGAVNPSEAEVLEDLQILVDHGFNLIRLYDTDENSQATLRLIAKHKLPIKVVQGIWLRAEISNHEGCPWLDEPIPVAQLNANQRLNVAETQKAIALVKQYPDIIVAVNVGNEALVEWNDHMVSVDAVIDYVRMVKQQTDVAVTVADNYEWWAESGYELAQELDFIGVHTYPIWEGKTIEESLAYTVANIEKVHRAIPNKPIVILEAGWATTANEFSVQANPSNQTTYYQQLLHWATTSNTTVLFFEAFDEPWKGDPNKLNGAEKHWGLFYVDRSPKQVVTEFIRPHLTNRKNK